MNRQNCLDQTKQGLQNINKDQINSIINDQTYGSAKYLMAQQKSAKQEVQSQLLLQKSKSLFPAQIEAVQKQVDMQIYERLSDQFRQLPKIVMLVDFDSFFAQVEQRDNPKLRNKPVAVVGGSIVCTSSYEAREFGVRAAMPVRVAKELCSSLICVETNHHKYSEIGRSAGQIFKKYDPNFHQLSVDEAEVDLTDVVMRQTKKFTALPEQVQKQTNMQCPNPTNIEFVAACVAFEIRAEVFKLLNLTCSCGVAISTQFGKIGADLKKPNGQTIMQLSFSDEAELLRYSVSMLKSFPIRKIYGIGAATAQQLSSEPFNIQKIGEIYEKRGLIMTLLTPSTINLIYASCGLQQLFEGFDGDDFKSIGHSTTFPETGSLDEIHKHLRELCKGVCGRMNKHEVIPKRFHVKVRFADWSEVSHVDDLPRKDGYLDTIYTAAAKQIDLLISSKKQKSNNLVTVGLGQARNDVPAWYVRLVSVSCLEWMSNVQNDVQLEQVLKKEQLKCFSTIKQEQGADMMQFHVQKVKDDDKIVVVDDDPFLPTKIKPLLCPLCRRVFAGSLDLHMPICQERLDSKNEKILANSLKQRTAGIAKFLKVKQ